MVDGKSQDPGEKQNYSNDYKHSFVSGLGETPLATARLWILLVWILLLSRLTALTWSLASALTAGLVLSARIAWSLFPLALIPRFVGVRLVLLLIRICIGLHAFLSLFAVIAALATDLSSAFRTPVASGKSP